VACWALVLVGGIAWAGQRGEPTAREQTTVARAASIVDSAAAELATAATADGLAVVAVSPFERAAGCSVTVLRDGARYQRTVTALVAPGTEQALLERVGARLPARYQARVRTGAVPRLVADAGMFVGVTGVVNAPGLVRFVIDTGTCRPEGGPVSRLVMVGTPPVAAIQRSAVAALLVRLGVSAERWSTVRVACADGKTLTTVEAVGGAGALPGLDTQQHVLASVVDAALGQPSMDRPAVGTVVVGTPELFAYRAATSGVGVRVADGHPVITATSVCS
jgi:hypothetical protein